MAIDQSDIDDLEREIEGYRKAATPEAVQAAISLLNASVESSGTGPTSLSSTAEVASVLAAARILVFSPHKLDRKRGLEALEVLLTEGRSDVSEARLLTAAAHAEAHAFPAARAAIAALTLEEPANTRAAAFVELLKRDIKREGQRFFIAAAGAAAVGLVVAVAAYYWFSSRSQRPAATRLQAIPKPPAAEAYRFDRYSDKARR